jgi:alpha-L-fucosidase
VNMNYYYFRNDQIPTDIGLKADGTIPDVMQDRLRGIGDWLLVNGEVIYGTKPWKIYGESPTTKEIGSRDNQSGEYQFRSGDVRFTRKGNALYAILLEWPGSEITINSLKGIKINKISMLGSDDNIQWRQIKEVLTVSLPLSVLSTYANTLKLECDEKLIDDCPGGEQKL